MLKKVFSYLNKSELTVNKPIVILDVGCRWGFADKFMINNTLSNMKIYGFDPDINECERLQQLYNNKNITLVPLGLSDTVGKKILHLTKEPACSSLYKPNEQLTQNYPALDCAKEVSQIEVDVTTLDTWANEFGVEYIDYIKIDTQGAELSILKGAVDILPSVRFLEVEVEFNPIYDGQPIFSDVDLFLREFGFVLWKFSNIVHYSKEKESDIILTNDLIHYNEHSIEHQSRGGQVFWADAFYVHKEIVDTNYNDKPIEQIKRDAEIALRLGFLDLKYRLDKEYENRVK